MTTGRINQVAALKTEAACGGLLNPPQTPPCCALPGAACFDLVWEQQARLRFRNSPAPASRPACAAAVPRLRARDPGHSLSPWPTRGSPRGYQPTIRKAWKHEASTPFRRLPRRASRRPPGAASFNAARRTPGVIAPFCLCVTSAHRAFAQASPPRAPRGRSRRALVGARAPRIAPWETAPALKPAPLRRARRYVCSAAPRRAGAHCHSSAYWAHAAPAPGRVATTRAQTLGARRPWAACDRSWFAGEESGR